MKAFDVYQDDDLIDTVFHNDTCDGGADTTAEMVRDGLVNHDGYSPDIHVVAAD